MLAASYLWLVLVSLSLLGSAQPFRIQVWCTDLLSVYIDGAKHVDFQNGFADIDVSESPRVFVVLCQHDVGEQNRLIANTSNGLVSDHSWRCNKEPSSDFGRSWAEQDYDDTDWDDAVVLSQNGHDSSVKDSQDDRFPHSAKYIWAKDDPQIVVCRARVGPVSVTAACNGDGTYYLDGIKAPYTTDFFTESYQHPLTNLPKLLAVQCTAPAGQVEWPAAILGAVHERNDVTALIGQHWRCSPEGAPDWYSMDFDDSSWPEGKFFQNNLNVWKHERFPVFANWVGETGKTLFCRYRVGFPAEVTTCDPDIRLYYIPDPEDCSKFAVCQNGVLGKYSCGEKLFDPVNHICALPHEVDCYTSSTITTSTTTTSTTSTTTQATTTAFSPEGVSTTVGVSDDDEDDYLPVIIGTVIGAVVLVTLVVVVVVVCRRRKGTPANEKSKSNVASFDQAYKVEAEKQDDTYDVIDDNNVKNVAKEASGKYPQTPGNVYTGSGVTGRQPVYSIDRQGNGNISPGRSGKTTDPAYQHLRSDMRRGQNTYMELRDSPKY